MDETKPKSKKWKYIIIGVVVYAVLYIVFAIVEPMIPKYVELDFLNPSGAKLLISIDGTEVKPASESGGVLAVSTKIGEHELTVKQGQTVILQERRTFEKGKKYAIFCGGESAWLKIQYVQYGVPSFTMVETYKLEVDGKTLSITISSQQELDECMKFFGSTSTLYTKPAFVVFDEGSNLLMPDESLPEKGELGSSKTALRYVQGSELTFCKRLVERAQ
jgi:hypothetical protein